MEKSEVYSWRVDPDLKSALEGAARAEGITVSRLLDRIVAEWVRRERAPHEEDEEIRRARQRAMRFVGSIHGTDPGRARAASQHVRAIVARKHAARRSD